MKLARPTTEPWRDPDGYWRSLAEATAGLDTPFGIIDASALAFNAHDMIRRAKSTPIRIASKSVRVRGVIDAVLELPGFRGVLAYTLAEALWLADTVDDVVVGYPSVDRAAIGALGRSASLAACVTIMIDSIEQLDVVDATLPPGQRENIRVCIELNASWRSRLVGYAGVFRSPIFSVEQATALARAVIARPGFTLVGLMSYESQIAGLANRPPGSPLRGRVIDWMQSNSAQELVARRGQVVAAVRELAELEFVNGGGTGSLEFTASDSSVTEIAAGSGLFGPHLFDGYSRFQPAPAAAFALSVVRKPTPDTATLLGGGWIASGPPGRDRLPQPEWPAGLEFIAREMAGEVQTPLTGAGALSIGDRVWMRHSKAGELSEHVNELAVVCDGEIVEMMPTYRGEGKAFL
jgi:D-serine deaminase-like pyridoxal phosphate-dependent protein